MKRWIYYIIIVISLLLLILIFKPFHFNSSDFTSEKKLRIRDTSEISRIQLLKSDKKIDLYKKDGLWRLSNGLKAQKIAVNKLLSLFYDISIRSEIAEQDKSNVVKLFEENGVTITFFKGEVQYRTYDILNSDSLTYPPLIKRKNSNKIFILQTFRYQNPWTFVYQLNPETWQNKTIVHYAPQQINTITCKHLNNPEKSFSIKVSNGQSQLYKLYPTKKTTDAKIKAIKRYLSYFQNIQYANTIQSRHKHLLDSLSNRKPDYIFEIKAKHNHSKTIEIYPITLTQPKISPVTSKKITQNLYYCYAIVNKDRLLKMKYMEIDPILKDITYFLPQ